MEGRGIALAAALVLAAAAPLSGAPEARVRLDLSRRLGPVSPLLHGHFLEFMYEGVKGGLWAELLRNRGFETPGAQGAPAAHWERDPDERIHDPRLGLSAERFGVDPSGYPAGSGSRALVLISTAGDRARRGIQERGIPLRAGVEYRASLWLRGAELAEGGKGASDRPFTGSVRITLEEDADGGRVYAERELTAITTEWRRFEAALPAGVADARARFTIQIRGRGVVWVDQASLLPGDARGGVRADVLERIQALRPAFIRWPGGNVAQDYHWEWGVGPRDARPVWLNMSWNDDPEPADFGTDEYVELCRAVGAEPAPVVNVEGRGATLSEAAALRAKGLDPRTASRKADPEEAAAWVEYCNGSAETRWGGLRARNGHPEPYRIRYWEIGNEIWGDWVRGHSDAAAYAAAARRYIRAMRAADPSISVIAVGHSDLEWDRTVLREIGYEIDYLSVHHYDGAGRGADGAALTARLAEHSRGWSAIGRMWNELAPGRRPLLAINEWNTSFPLPRQHSMDSALHAARFLLRFEQQADLVAMNAVSDLVNGWSGGIIQAGRDRLFTTPTYEVIRAFREAQGDSVLGWEMAGGPGFEISATSGSDGREVHLKAVNALAEAVKCSIEVAGGEGELDPGADAVVIESGGPGDSNGFESPSRIASRRFKLANVSRRFGHEFPARSVSVLTLRLQR